MNEPPDPLEEELAALRPVVPSPALRQRIAARLTEPPRSRAWRRVVIVLAGGLAAAGVAAALIWWTAGLSLTTMPTFVQTGFKPPRGLDDLTPALQPNRLTLTRSPENVDALLDDTPSLSGTAPHVHAFTRSKRELTALLGEP